MPQQAFQQAFLLDQLIYFLPIGKLIFQIVYVLHLFMQELSQSIQEISFTLLKIRTSLNIFSNCGAEFRAWLALPWFSIRPLNRKENITFMGFFRYFRNCFARFSLSQSAPWTAWQRMCLHLLVAITGRGYISITDVQLTRLCSVDSSLTPFRERALEPLLVCCSNPLWPY